MELPPTKRKANSSELLVVDYRKFGIYFDKFWSLTKSTKKAIIIKGGPILTKKQHQKRCEFPSVENNPNCSYITGYRCGLCQESFRLGDQLIGHFIFDDRCSHQHSSFESERLQLFFCSVCCTFLPTSGIDITDLVESFPKSVLSHIGQHELSAILSCKAFLVLDLSKKSHFILSVARLCMSKTNTQLALRKGITTPTWNEFGVGDMLEARRNQLGTDGYILKGEADKTTQFMLILQKMKITPKCYRCSVAKIDCVRAHMRFGKRLTFNDCFCICTACGLVHAFKRGKCPFGLAHYVSHSNEVRFTHPFVILDFTRSGVSFLCMVASCGETFSSPTHWGLHLVQHLPRLKANCQIIRSTRQLAEIIFANKPVWDILTQVFFSDVQQPGVQYDDTPGLLDYLVFAHTVITSIFYPDACDIASEIVTIPVRPSLSFLEFLKNRTLMTSSHEVDILADPITGEHDKRNMDCNITNPGDSKTENVTDRALQLQCDKSKSPSSSCDISKPEELLDCASNRGLYGDSSEPLLPKCYSSDTTELQQRNSNQISASRPSGFCEYPEINRLPNSSQESQAEILADVVPGGRSYMDCNITDHGYSKTKIVNDSKLQGPDFKLCDRLTLTQKQLQCNNSNPVAHTCKRSKPADSSDCDLNQSGTKLNRSELPGYQYYSSASFQPESSNPMESLDDNSVVATEASVPNGPLTSTIKTTVSDIHVPLITSKHCVGEMKATDSSPPPMKLRKYDGDAHVVELHNIFAVVQLINRLRGTKGVVTDALWFECGVCSKKYISSVLLIMHIWAQRDSHCPLWTKDTAQLFHCSKCDIYLPIVNMDVFTNVFPRTVIRHILSHKLLKNTPQNFVCFDIFSKGHTRPLYTILQISKKNLQHLIIDRSMSSGNWPAFASTIPNSILRKHIFYELFSCEVCPVCRVSSDEHDKSCLVIHRLTYSFACLKLSSTFNRPIAELVTTCMNYAGRSIVISCDPADRFVPTNEVLTASTDLTNELYRSELSDGCHDDVTFELLTRPVFIVDTSSGAIRVFCAYCRNGFSSISKWGLHFKIHIHLFPLPLFTESRTNLLLKLLEDTSEPIWKLVHKCFFRCGVSSVDSSSEFVSHLTSAHMVLNLLFAPNASKCVFTADVTDVVNILKDGNERPDTMSDVTVGVKSELEPSCEESIPRGKCELEAEGLEGHLTVKLESEDLPIPADNPPLSLWDNTLDWEIKSEHGESPVTPVPYDNPAPIV